MTTLHRTKPRNPWVAAARFRRAGAHAAGRKTERQAARAALRQLLMPGPLADSDAPAPDTRPPPAGR